MALKDEQAQQNGRVSHEVRGHEPKNLESTGHKAREIRSIQENGSLTDSALPRSFAPRVAAPEPETPTQTLTTAKVSEPKVSEPTVSESKTLEPHAEASPEPQPVSEQSVSADEDVHAQALPPTATNGTYGEHTAPAQAEAERAPVAAEGPTQLEPTQLEPTEPELTQPEPKQTTKRPSSAPVTDLGPTILNAVKIKGRAGGVLVEIGDGAWSDIEAAIEARLDSAEGFFRGARVVLDMAGRTVGGGELRTVAKLLEVHDMKLTIVRATSQQTLRAASDMGLITSVEEVDPTHEIDSRPAVKPAGQGRPSHYVHRGHLRSGQVLKRYESIVVLGDVNPGAQIISAGDIVIWGRLRGVAFAGADGSRRATVSALDFSPTQLRIANLAAIAPEQVKSRRSIFFWKKEPPRKPEVARISENRIVVEPWDDGRPMAGGARRRLTT